MTPEQDALLEAVTTALTNHAQMHGAWILTYEEQRIEDDGEIGTGVFSVGDGSPTGLLGLLDVTHHRMRAELAEEEK